MRRNVFIIFILFFFINCSLYAAEEYQDLTILNQRAHDFLQEKIKVGAGEKAVFSLGQFDNRLHLPKCDPEKIKIFFPHGDNMLTTKSIGISCNDQQEWTIYTTAKIEIYVKIAVATQNIPKDTLFDSNNVELIEKDRASLATGYFTSLQPLTQMVAKRAIMAGNIITPNLAQAEIIIRRGDQVMIGARSNNLKVEMMGIAKADGGIGEHIDVMNSSSKRTIEATVVAPGKVEVTL